MLIVLFINPVSGHAEWLVWVGLWALVPMEAGFITRVTWRGAVLEQSLNLNCLWLMLQPAFHTGTKGALARPPRPAWALHPKRQRSSNGQCYWQANEQFCFRQQPSMRSWTWWVEGCDFEGGGRLWGQSYLHSSMRMLFAFLSFILSYVRWNFPEVICHVIAQQIDCRIRLKYSFSSNYVFAWSLIFFMYFHQNNILQQIACRRQENPAVCEAELKDICKKVQTVSLLARLFLEKYSYFPWKKIFMLICNEFIVVIYK